MLPPISHAMQYVNNFCTYILLITGLALVSRNVREEKGKYNPPRSSRNNTLQWIRWREAPWASVCTSWCSVSSSVLAEPPGGHGARSPSLSTLVVAAPAWESAGPPGGARRHREPASPPPRPRLGRLVAQACRHRPASPPPRPLLSRRVARAVIAYSRRCRPCLCWARRSSGRGRGHGSPCLPCQWPTPWLWNWSVARHSLGQPSFGEQDCSRRKGQI